MYLSSNAISSLFRTCIVYRCRNMYSISFCLCFCIVYTIIDTRSTYIKLKISFSVLRLRSDGGVRHRLLLEIPGGARGRAGARLESRLQADHGRGQHATWPPRGVLGVQTATGI